MLRNRKRTITFVLMLILVLTGCSVGEKSYDTLIEKDLNNVKEEHLNQYDIDIVFKPEEKSYEGKQTISYRNNENIELDKVYFHLYPNAFKHKETAPFLFNDFDAAYPDGFKQGYMDIKKVTVKGQDVSVAVLGRGQTVLKVPLDTPLKPGEKIDIYMEYNVVMPPAHDRFGYSEKTFNFGNWYPVAAVYDDEGWNLDPYYSIGDPFYSDTSNYHVEIKAPKDMVIATSGNVLSQDKEDDNRIWNIEAKYMRDFAWVASRDFIVKEKEVDGTLVKVYFLENNEAINDFAAQISYDAIEIFNKVFGKYPYGQYSVVATSFPSGMEYPGIVFIGESYYSDQGKDFLETVIAHETGHQWWYSLVGNDQIDEAWLDESLTSYSEVIYATEKYGKDVANNYYTGSIESYYNNKKVMVQNNETILKPLDQFKNWDDYGPLVYGKGAMFIHEIEKIYGQETLYKILQEHYKRHRFLNVTTDDFKKVCEDVTGEDFTEIMETWLYQR